MKKLEQVTRAIRDAADQSPEGLARAAVEAMLEPTAEMLAARNGSVVMDADYVVADGYDRITAAILYNRLVAGALHQNRPM
jgi:hypothetical protein